MIIKCNRGDPLETHGGLYFYEYKYEYNFISTSTRMTTLLEILNNTQIQRYLLIQCIQFNTPVYIMVISEHL